MAHKIPTHNPAVRRIVSLLILLVASLLFAAGGDDTSHAAAPAASPGPSGIGGARVPLAGEPMFELASAHDSSTAARNRAQSVPCPPPASRDG